MSLQQECQMIENNLYELVLPKETRQSGHESKTVLIYLKSFFHIFCIQSFINKFRIKNFIESLRLYCISGDGSVVCILCWFMRGTLLALVARPRNIPNSESCRCMYGNLPELLPECSTHQPVVRTPSNFS